MTCEPNHEQTAKVELKVNGRQVDLNDFVENLIGETVLGMIKSLRGVGRIETAELSITRVPD